MSGDAQTPGTTGSEDDDDEEVFDGAKLPHTEIDSDQDGADSRPAQPPPSPPRLAAEMSFAEELGINSLFESVVGGRGRLFSAAGPKAPVAEFTEDFLVLHPPQKPFIESEQGENIVINVDEFGVLLDDLGQRKHIAGARYRGATLWFSGEQMPGTLKHYAVWFDELGKAHKLYVEGEPMTTDKAFRCRNKTHDGELFGFEDIESD